MTVRIGLEALLTDQIELVAGRRVGLVASASSVDAVLVSSVERLRQHPAVSLRALFRPEHGLRGDTQAGEHVGTSTDRVTGLPLIVLDRPAPLNGVMVEGPTLDPRFASFVGPYPIPLRYGLTAGEIARLFNTAFNIKCDLTVVPLDGWRRSMWFDDTGLLFVPLSPNLPTLDSLTVYPGTCLVEGTTLSEGRRTTRPFEYIGVPWVDGEALAEALNALNLPGVRFRPVYFVPAFSKHAGQVCAGVHLCVTDRSAFRPVETALHLLAQVKRAHPAHFAWRAPWMPGGHYPIDLLSGSDQVRLGLEAGSPVAELVDTWKEDVEDFKQLRAPYLLYPV